MQGHAEVPRGTNNPENTEGRRGHFYRLGDGLLICKRNDDPAAIKNISALPRFGASYTWGKIRAASIARASRYRFISSVYPYLPCPSKASVLQ